MKTDEKNSESSTKQEAPIIDQTNDLKQKLILKGKKLGYINLSEIESELAHESSDSIEEFQSKITSMGIKKLCHHIFDFSKMTVVEVGDVSHTNLKKLVRESFNL